MTDILPWLGLLQSWWDFLLLALTLVIARRTVVRLCSLLFPADDPRRKELLAELERLPYWRRPLWAVEQIETGLVDGLAPRSLARIRRHRAQQASPEVVFLPGGDLVSSGWTVNGKAMSVGQMNRLCKRMNLSVTLATGTSSATLTIPKGSAPQEILDEIERM